MKHLTEISRCVYGHDATAINRHSERVYEDQTGMRYILSSTLDGVPPFFEAYGPFTAEHRGILPRLKVSGEDYWGSGWSWTKALKAFCLALKAEVRA